MHERHTQFRSILAIMIGFIGFAASPNAKAEGADVFCTIRSQGAHLDCLWSDKDVRRKMTSQDISNFIDQAQTSAYITVKSRAGNERIFQIDPEATSFKHLRTIEKTASISDIIKAKSELFNEIEARLVKLSEDLDSQASAAGLVKYDPSIAVDYAKLEKRGLVQEVEGYRKNDANYVKAQQRAATDSNTIDLLVRPKNRLSVNYSTVGYTGNFSSLTQSNYRSVDNLAAMINYRYSTGRWMWEAESEYFTAYSNFNKGTSGTPTFAGTDSSKAVYNFVLRGNYCYVSGTTQICPGMELLYDQFPIIGFKTLNFTGTNPNNTSTLEMQSATDLTVGANLMVNFPLYRSIILENRLGYIYGTHAFAMGSNKPKSNTGYYLTSTVEIPIAQNMAATVGLSYLIRTASVDMTGTTNANLSTTVDNTGINEFDTRIGLVWMFGGE